MNNAACFSSNSEEWRTPDNLYDRLTSEFHFDLDVAASRENSKCYLYYHKGNSGLTNEWSGNIWCNPPYGRSIGLWVKKASEEIAAGRSPVIVMLLPARTDTRWFHDYIYNSPRVEIRFLKGRLKFSNSKDNAPFPSMLVIFRSSV